MKFGKYVIFLIPFLIAQHGITSAQDWSKLNLFVHYSKFFDSNNIIIVKGIVPSILRNEYDKICEFRAKNKYTIKEKNSLNAQDLKKKLLFVGLVNSFDQLDRFVPSPFNVSAKGFEFGPYKFNDSLDVIYLFSDDSKRLFILGNSLESIRSLYPMEVGMEQYMIVQNYTPTHHGYLSNGEFDSSKHVDIVKERAKVLRRNETDHYVFYYSPETWPINKADSLFQGEENKYQRVLSVLDLQPPKRKIECCVYKDQYQKFRLSFTRGDGNVFSGAWQIHSTGLNSVEHETIHLIFDSKFKHGVQTFLSEGVVGYYYCTLSKVEWQKKKQYVKEHLEQKEIDKLIMNEHYFWRVPEFSYSVSAHFVKFLIDKYGLNSFKSLCNEPNVKKSFITAYNKSMKQIIEEWRDFVLSSD